MNKEGFISFGGDKQPIDKVWVSQYSTTKTVTKLDDNLFFDQTNGNLIELDAAAVTGTTYDNTGISIKNVLVTPRNNTGTSVYPCELSGADKSVVKQDTEQSKINSVSKTLTYWMYPSQCLSTTTTNTFYIAWGDTTYINVFTKNANDWGLTNMFYFNSNNIGYVDSNKTTETTFITSPATPDNNPNNNKLVNDTLYDNNKKIYQLSKNVRYDIQNGNLIIHSASSEATQPDSSCASGQSGSITVYDRYKTVLTDKKYETTIKSVDFKPWWVVDNDAQLIVIYMPNGTNTVIGLVSYDDKDKTSMTMVNLKRFNEKGADDGSSNELPSCQNKIADLSDNKIADLSDNKITDLSDNKIKDQSGNIPLNQPDSVISEYFKWYWYWKSSASASDTNSDYILKTQIVPPVCPSCPACFDGNCSGTACSNCGGQGGSGTLSGNGISIFDACGNKTTCEKIGANKFGYDASKNKVYCYNNNNVNNSNNTNTNNNTNSAGSSNNNQNNVGGVFNNAVDEIGGTANKLIDTTGSIVSGVVNTTGGVLNTAANDITGIFKPRGNYGGVSSAQPGSQNIIGSEPQGINQRSSYYGTQNQPVDQYNYYGQLPTRGSSSYIPITADFSAFGK